MVGPESEEAGIETLIGLDVDSFTYEDDDGMLHLDDDWVNTVVDTNEISERAARQGFEERTRFGIALDRVSEALERIETLMDTTDFNHMMVVYTNAITLNGHRLSPEEQESFRLDAKRYKKEYPGMGAEFDYPRYDKDIQHIKAAAAA